MKLIDIAIKDLTRNFRSAFALVFMFGVPLLVTGMFYFMFGNIAREGGFNLPRVKVAIANMDLVGPNSRSAPRTSPAASTPIPWASWWRASYPAKTWLSCSRSTP